MPSKNGHSVARCPTRRPHRSWLTDVRFHLVSPVSRRPRCPEIFLLSCLRSSGPGRSFGRDPDGARPLPDPQAFLGGWRVRGSVRGCRERGNWLCELEIVRRSDDAPREAWLEEGQEPPVSEGFKVVKWRWIIERTFGWLGRYRRLSKGYEQSPASSLAWVRLALVAILIHRFGES
ncbi:MAG: hypothetical protein EOM03_06260 [Clostridia bacterium]|nr:hypothetical protein [Clostridia bacterium]